MHHLGYRNLTFHQQCFNRFLWLFSRFSMIFKCFMDVLCFSTSFPNVSRCNVAFEAQAAARRARRRPWPRHPIRTPTAPPTGPPYGSHLRNAKPSTSCSPREKFIQNGLGTWMSKVKPGVKPRFLYLNE